MLLKYLLEDIDYKSYGDENIEINKETQVTIFTIQGRIIYNNTIYSDTTIQLSNGIYIVVIEGNTEKIIIQ